jgi:hypothetical protein
VGLGLFHLPITLTNRGPTPCRVTSGDVSLDAHLSGRTQRLGSIVDGGAVLLKSGKPRTLMADFPEQCPASDGDKKHEFTPLRVAVRGGSVPVSGARLPATIAVCKAATMGFEDEISPQDAGTGPYSSLHLDIQAPDSAIGPTLAYTISITNTGRTTFSWHGCPTYTQESGLAQPDGKGPETSLTQTNLLNCTVAPTIEPGATVVFAMQLKLPTGLGQLKFAWLMKDGPSSAAGVTRVDNSGDAGRSAGPAAQLGSPCVARDLTVRPVLNWLGGGMAGERAYPFRISNSSAKVCAIGGYPTVQVRNAVHHVVPFTYSYGRGRYVQQGSPRAFQLGAGESAYLLVARYRCDVREGQVGTHLEIGLPGRGGQLSVALGRMSFPRCNGQAPDAGNDVEVSAFMQAKDWS